MISAVAELSETDLSKRPETLTQSVPVEEHIRKILRGLSTEDVEHVHHTLLRLETDPNLAALLKCHIAIHLRVIDIASLDYVNPAQDGRLWRQAQAVLATAGDIEGLNAVMGLLRRSVRSDSDDPLAISSDPYCNAAFLQQQISREKV